MKVCLTTCLNIASECWGLQDEVLDQLMADQALSKGQRVNIGSPGSFFRPVYATIAGTKRSMQGKMQGKLQIISTSVLSDTELLAQTQQRLEVVLLLSSMV